MKPETKTLTNDPQSKRTSLKPTIIILFIICQSACLAPRQTDQMDQVGELFIFNTELIPVNELEVVENKRTLDQETKQMLDLFKKQLAIKILNMRNVKYSKFSKSMSLLYGFSTYEFDNNQILTENDSTKYDDSLMGGNEYRSDSLKRKIPRVRSMYEPSRVSSKLKSGNLDKWSEKKTKSDKNLKYRRIETKSERLIPTESLDIMQLENSISRKKLKFAPLEILGKKKNLKTNNSENDIIYHVNEKKNPKLKPIKGDSIINIDTKADKKNKEDSINIKDDKSRTDLHSSNFDSDNRCVKNSEQMSIKEYLKAFAESECSPVMIMPGIFATKLVVEIFCETMKEKSPDMFRMCGWTGCEHGLLTVAPEKEYILWVPDLLGNLSLISLNQKKNDCFVKMFTSKFDKKAMDNQDFDNMFMDTRALGWKVNLFGGTPKSRHNHGCGRSALDYVLPYNISGDGLGGTKVLMDSFRAMGYRDGLTMQALPYDFRLASTLNKNFKKSFKLSLERIRKLTGKKSMVIAHSFGTVNSYSALLDLSKEDKKRLVDVWVPVGAPLMGNVELMGALVSGQNPLSLLDGVIGLNKQQSLEIFYNLTSSFDMLPFNFWKFVHEPWFKTFVLNRTVSELKTESPEITRPTFFPDPKSECYKGLLGSNLTCSFFSSIFPDRGMINLKNRSYRVSDMEDFLEDVEASYNDISKPSFKQLYSVSRGNYRNYPNPGVPVVMFIYNTKQTYSEYTFPQDKINFYKAQNFERATFHSGDGTVESYSALVPFMKWAYEYAHMSGDNYYPVKLVDMCSKIDRKSHPYDSDDYQNRFGFNSYIGK